MKEKYEDNFEAELNAVDPNQPIENMMTYSQALQMYRGGLAMKSKNKLIEDMVHIMGEQMKIATALEAKGIHLWFVNGKFSDVTIDKK